MATLDKIVQNKLISLFCKETGVLQLLHRQMASTRSLITIGEIAVKYCDQFQQENIFDDALKNTKGIKNYVLQISDDLLKIKELQRPTFNPLIITTVANQKNAETLVVRKSLLRNLKALKRICKRFKEVNPICSHAKS